MSSQIVFKAKSERLKEQFAKRAKQEGVPMSTVLNAMMEEYVSGRIAFGITHFDDLDFHELSEDEITDEMRMRIEESKKKPLSAFTNI
jgi:hypothetical protein